MPQTPTQNPRSELDLSACSPELIAQLESVDLSAEHNESFITTFEKEQPGECTLAAIALLADRVDARWRPLALADFGSLTATYARFLSPEAVTRVKAAFLRFPFSQWPPRAYLLGVTHNKIDVRAHLRGAIAERWDFDDPRDEHALTWVYYKYLTVLGEPGALDKLAQKVADTRDGNRVTIFLQDLAGVDAEGVEAVLKRYAEDTRRAQGTDGPGMMLKESIPFLLAQHDLVRHPPKIEDR